MKDIYQINSEILELLNNKGFVVIDKILNDEECKTIISMYNDPILFRKTIAMERYRFGAGEYKYFTYPLPDIIQRLRENLYHLLFPVANTWFEALNIELQFPESHAAFIKACREGNQTLATPLILKYGIGGYNTLHQDLYGDI